MKISPANGCYGKVNFEALVNMTNTMTINYLFFFGVGIPLIITVALFVVFLLCWNKYRIRRQIMTKKFDPHRKNISPPGSLAPSETYYTPRPPLPPARWIYTSASTPDTQCILPQDNQGFDASPCSASGEHPHLQQQHHQHIYQTFHDSGMSELSELQDNNEQRPNSQASTDSEDSGFRSSRSGQYLHSAQNSNAQDVPFRKSPSAPAQCLQEIPLFQPIRHNKDPLPKIPSEEHIECVGMDRDLQKLNLPSHRSKRKLKRSLMQSTSPECLDLLDIQLAQQAHPSKQIPMLSPPFGHLTFTTATVHQSNFEDRSPAIAYSVV